MLFQLVVEVLFGLAVLVIVIVFPGLSFREWAKKKFGEAENGEPVVWK